MIYECVKCGLTSPVKMGKCHKCNEWNCFEEKKESKKNNLKLLVSNKLSDLKTVSNEQIESSIIEMDRVLGGGFTVGSTILLGGEPGIGKSTLALQLAANLSNSNSVLYVSAEESISQINLRSKRLGITYNNLFILNDASIDQILLQIEDSKPNIMIIDSIHALTSNDLDSPLGSISHLKTSSQTLSEYCKKNLVILVLICHITKDGTIAGPKTLEHLVDTVLYFDQIESDELRILRTTKNRFGPTNEIGIFKMTEKGLIEVSESSNIFISDSSNSYPGTAISSTFEGSRSILIEIQSLVSAPSQSYGKRYSNGIEINRINMLIAILEKFSKITFNDKDIFVNVSKGVKVKDPSVDLAIIAALLSSFKDLTIPADNVFIGEVGLGGEVKTVTKIEKRIKEFERMGFKKCYISSQSIAQSKDLQRYSSNQMKLISIKNINELNQHIGEVE